MSQPFVSIQFSDIKYSHVTYFFQENGVTLGQTLGRLCRVCYVCIREAGSYNPIDEWVPKGRESRR